MFCVQIVDDEPIVRLGLKKLIPWEQLGFRVVCEAQNGEEGLQQLKENKVDLIITDIEMPIMDGIEYIKRVKESKGKQVIVILTAYAEFGYAKSAIRYGVADYILKPIVEEQIIKVLEQIKEKLIVSIDRSFSREKDNKLIESVLLTDKKAFELLEDILEEEAQYDKEDISGTCFRFSYILEEIVQAVNKKYYNLNKLERLDLYLTLNQQKYMTKADLMAQFEKEVKSLFSILESYMVVYKDNVVRLACQYVVEHVDDKISLTEISDALGISKNYFCSLFKQETSENFLNYVTRTKIKRAKYLLKEKNMRIYEVCNYLGYTDTTYFTKLFKKYIGMTPNEYKKTECENYEISE
ncbi:AraC family two component transcriptional regulator [Kineothrix alysoides]|uniref:Stage 0 sporulation protein A homolog n=1 Tax=Kineothrix alysoides TaxID=1469948 RepID=A0A4R1QS09_9FIRM|nr:response regulator [Kineothrix alysoides]TCL56669.1 AraC family two component transcriptional regulator [Kineothrix alysoides]